jgi:hypothetical protein
MNRNALKEWYLDNKLPVPDYELACALLDDFDSTFSPCEWEAVSQAQLDAWIASLLAKGPLTIPMFRQMMRMMRFAKNNARFVDLTKYTGGIGVLEQIFQRLERICGTEALAKVTADYQIPPLGTAPSSLPASVQDLMARMQLHLTTDQIETVLAGNNHQIPVSAFTEEKVLYETSPTLEVYLKDSHALAVQELKDHMREGKVWFEQIITQEVVDLVQSNQEILSARLVDEKLYMTKIPYDSVAYLHASDAKNRRYQACHCPFAREAILLGTPDINPLWCYCSGGFHKFPYEVILDQKLKIKCIANALEDDSLCRFVIDLNDVEYRGKPQKK